MSLRHTALKLARWLGLKTTYAVTLRTTEGLLTLTVTVPGWMDEIALAGLMDAASIHYKTEAKAVVFMQRVTKTPKAKTQQAEEKDDAENKKICSE